VASIRAEAYEHLKKGERLPNDSRASRLRWLPLRGAGACCSFN
jgi:hypothetical protein